MVSRLSLCWAIASIVGGTPVIVDFSPLLSGLNDTIIFSGYSTGGPTQFTFQNIVRRKVYTVALWSDAPGSFNTDFLGNNTKYIHMSDDSPGRATITTGKPGYYNLTIRRIDCQTVDLSPVYSVNTTYNFTLNSTDVVYPGNSPSTIGCIDIGASPLDYIVVDTLGPYSIGRSKGPSARIFRGTLLQDGALTESIQGCGWPWGGPPYTMILSSLPAVSSSLAITVSRQKLRLVNMTLGVQQIYSDCGPVLPSPIPPVCGFQTIYELQFGGFEFVWEGPKQNVTLSGRWEGRWGPTKLMVLIVVSDDVAELCWMDGGGVQAFTLIPGKRYNLYTGYQYNSYLGAHNSQWFLNISAYNPPSLCGDGVYSPALELCEPGVPTTGGVPTTCTTGNVTCMSTCTYNYSTCASAQFYPGRIPPPGIGFPAPEPSPQPAPRPSSNLHLAPVPQPTRKPQPFPAPTSPSPNTKTTTVPQPIPNLQPFPAPTSIPPTLIVVNKSGACPPLGTAATCTAGPNVGSICRVPCRNDTIESTVCTDLLQWLPYSCSAAFSDSECNTAPVVYDGEAQCALPVAVGGTCPVTCSKGSPTTPLVQCSGGYWGSAICLNTEVIIGECGVQVLTPADYITVSVTAPPDVVLISSTRMCATRRFANGFAFSGSPTEVNAALCTLTAVPLKRGSRWLLKVDVSSTAKSILSAVDGMRVNPNHAPELRAPLHLTKECLPIGVAHTSSFRIADLVVDVDNQTITVSLGPEVQYFSLAQNDETFILTVNPPKDTLGKVINVVLLATDGYANVTVRGSVTVCSNNPPRPLRGTRDIAVGEGEEKQYSLVQWFTDLEGDAMSFVLQASPPEALPDWVRIEGTVLYVKPSPKSSGAHHFLVGASDEFSGRGTDFVKVQVLVSRTVLQTILLVFGVAGSVLSVIGLAIGIFQKRAMLYNTFLQSRFVVEPIEVENWDEFEYTPEHPTRSVGDVFTVVQAKAAQTVFPGVIGKWLSRIQTVESTSHFVYFDESVGSLCTTGVNPLVPITMRFKDTAGFILLEVTFLPPEQSEAVEEEIYDTLDETGE